MNFKMTIRKKIILITVCIVLISSFLSSSIFLANYYKTRKEEAIKQLNNSIEKTTVSIYDKLGLINDSAFSLFSLDIFKNWRNHKINFSTNGSYVHIYALIRDVQNSRIFDSAWSAKYIKNISLCADGSNIILSTRTPESINKMQTQINKMYKEIENEPSMGFFYYTKDNHIPSIYYIRKMHDLNSNKELSLAFLLNMDTVFRELNILGESVSAKVVYKDKIIYSNNDNLESIDNLTNYYVVEKKISNTDFAIIISVPKSTIMEPINNSIKFYIIITIILTIILAAISGIIASTYTNFIKELYLGITKVKESNYNTTLKSYKDPELDQISIAFNQMASETKHLIETVYESEILLKNTEIKLLQSQINPHFLVNTLTTIGTHAYMKGDEQSYKMTSALCKMLSSTMHNLSDSSSFITIEKEIEYIQCYLYIQQIRFQDKLKFSINMEHSFLKNYYIPRLSIEPFVENSVIHGIETTTDTCTISIGIKEVDNDLLIEVSDNGKGFDVNSVMNNKKLEHNGEHHIGIYNTNKRLQLLFGPFYGIHFESIPFQLTIAHIKIPKITEPSIYSRKQEV